MSEFKPRQIGQVGQVMVFEGQEASNMASIFRVPADWSLVTINWMADADNGRCFAAYDGERFTLFTCREDFIPE